VIKDLILSTSCKFEPFIVAHIIVINASGVRWWASCLLNYHLLDL